MECYNALNDLFEVLSENITSKDYETVEQISDLLEELELLGVNSDELNGVSAFRDNTMYIPRLTAIGVDADLEKVVVNAEFSTDITNVKLTLTKNGEIVNNYETDIDGKNIILTMKNDYDYTSPYILTINEDIKSAEMSNLTLGKIKKYNFTVPRVFDIAKFELRDKNGGTLNSADDLQAAVSNETIYGDFEIKNYALDDGVETAVTIAVYSAEGEMVTSVSKVADLAKGESVLWENIELRTGLTSLKGGRIKMYIWDSFSEMNSFFKDHEINF